ncbi:MAG: GyrI-like domain-containing protein [Pseudolabrys sp.]
MPCLRLAAPILFALALGVVPALAQNTPPALGSPSPLKPGDAFGEEVTLPERTMVYLKGSSKWDGAFDTLVDAFKSLDEYLGKMGIKPAGPAMTIYTQTDDAGFSFEAAVPVAAAPDNPPKGDIAVGPAPSGKALKFVHRGAYDAMDSTYEAITNYLDDKHLDAKDLFIEEYVTDPVKTKADELVINIYVPVK